MLVITQHLRISRVFPWAAHRFNVRATVMFAGGDCWRCQPRIEFGGRQLRVTPAQLDGEARAQAWQRITQLQPRYAGYEQKTDRSIPVIRLSRAD